MSEVIRKDKYCLKGDFYKALEEIDWRLRYGVPKSFRKEVNLDLIELFFRNQSDGKTLNETIGESVDEFINDILCTYYSTLGKKELVKYFFENSLLYSICTVIIYCTSFIGYKNINVIGFPIIISAIIGFIVGAISYYTSYKIACKNLKVRADVVKTFCILIPFEIIIIFNDSIYNLTTKINISQILIMLIILLEVSFYFVLKFSHTAERKCN